MRSTVAPPDFATYSSEPIEIDIDGQTLRGIRFVSGTHEVWQKVHYFDLWQLDPRPHRPRDVSRMRSIARVILRDLVEQWRAREVKRPVKVTKPRGKRRVRAMEPQG